MSRVLKVVLWIVAILALAVGAIMLFVDPVVTVTRTATVNAPADIVFEQVNDLHNWEKWSPWAERDPNMTLTYHGSGIGAGSAYSWKSDQDNVGSGTLSIVESDPFQGIKTSIEFEGMGESQGAWTFASTDNDATEVSWSMTSDAGMDPMARFFNLLMDDLVGGDFEKGLASLNKVSQEALALRKEREQAEAAALEAPADTDMEVQ